MKTLSLCLSICVGLAAPGLAQDVPERLALDDPGMIVVTGSVIPIPLEIFASLDKLGQQDWSRQVASRVVDLDTNRSRTAMLFGLVVSDGFIAVQAQDREAVRRVGREVLRLATSLGVSREVEGHAHAVVDGAAAADWGNVRQELDKTRQTVINKMREIRDDELVALVSLGGWLGGTQALAAVLKDNYSAEGSDLLNQLDLVRQLKDEYQALPKRVKRGEVFQQVYLTLDQLESLMRADESGAISEGKVDEISLATKSLVNAIYEG